MEKKSFFTGRIGTYLKRTLCNSLIQPHIDFACCAWYPNLIKNKEINIKKLQTVQNTCIRFSLGKKRRSRVNQ